MGTRPPLRVGLEVTAALQSRSSFRACLSLPWVLSLAIRKRRFFCLACVPRTMAEACFAAHWIIRAESHVCCLSSLVILAGSRAGIGPACVQMVSMMD